MEQESKTGLVGGLVVVAAIVVFGFVWVMLGATGRIPDIGLGLSVDPLYFFMGLVVAAVVLYAIYPKPKKEE